MLRVNVLDIVDNVKYIVANVNLALFEIGGRPPSRA